MNELFANQPIQPRSIHLAHKSNPGKTSICAQTLACRVTYSRRVLHNGHRSFDYSSTIIILMRSMFKYYYFLLTEQSFTRPSTVLLCFRKYGNVCHQKHQWTLAFERNSIDFRFLDSQWKERTWKWGWHPVIICLPTRMKYPSNHSRVNTQRIQ